MRKWVVLGIALLVLATASVPAVGQAVFGSIFGTVTDPQGAAVPNAKVTVTDVNKGTTDQATTNESGNYSVTHLIPDTYSVRIEASGFKAFEQKEVAVRADYSQRVDAQVALGSTSETLEVTGEAPQLQTDRADVATEFSQTYVQDLPNLNRNFNDFVLNTPGSQRLVGWSHAATENPQGAGQIFINGQHFSGTGFELDGTDNQDPILGIIVINPNLEAVTEAKFALQDYDAEKGNAVAGNVSAQTRSGTNEFHGSAFWFRRTGANQARDPFTQFAPNPVTGRFIPGSKWQQFGGALGGPIIKNKLFFFGDYQGMRQSTGVTNALSVPTAVVHNTCLGPGHPGTFCDMSQYLGNTPTGGQVYNPFTGDQTGANRTAFSGNLIPNDLISPQAVAFLQLIPLPNVAGQNNGTFLNYIAGGSGPYSQNAFDTRIDWTASNSVNVFGRYSQSYFSLSGQPSLGAAGGIGFGPGPGLSGSSNIHNYSLAIGATKTFSTNWLADFRLGWMKYNPQTSKWDQTATPMNALGFGGNLNNSAQPVATGGLAAFFNDNGNYPPNGNDTMSNYGDGLNVGRCNCPLTENESQWQGVTNWTHTMGNHTLKFGADIRSANNLRVPSDANRTGQFNFKTATTSDGGVGGIDMASFLLGTVGTFNRYYSQTLTASEHQWRMFFYGQDTWRITPKLTMNYGLRWEIYTPESVNAKGNGGFANISLAPGPGNGVIRVGGYGPYGLNGNINDNWHAFAPRFGVAYQMNERTVIRGGFGVSYDIGVFGSNFGHTVTQNLPVLINQNVDATNSCAIAPGQNSCTINPNASTNFVPAFTLAQGPPAASLPAIPASGTLPLGGFQNNIQPKVRPTSQVLPEVANYNLAFQYQWTNTFNMEIAYVGNEGRHGFAGDGPSYNVNPVNIQNWALTQAGILSQSQRQFYNNKFSYVDPSTGNVILCCNGGILGDYLGNDANSSYNSLQVKGTKNMSHGLQFQAFFTWSRSLHYAGTNAYAVYPHLDYGPWDQNRQTVFLLNAVYDLPFGKGKAYGSNMGKAGDLLLGGWQIAGTMNWSSGLPFTPSYSDCNADQDVGICRPNWGNQAQWNMGGGSFNPVTHTVTYYTPIPTMTTPGQCYGAWCRPVGGTLGDTGPQALYGPRFFTANASLFKNFKLTERFGMQFRMDVINLFNHPVLGFNSNQGNTCIDCSGGGQVTDIESDTTMRQLTFALKLMF